MVLHTGLQLVSQVPDLHSDQRIVSHAVHVHGGGGQAHSGTEAHKGTDRKCILGINE